MTPEQATALLTLLENLPIGLQNILAYDHTLGLMLGKILLWLQVNTALLAVLVYASFQRGKA